MRILLTICVVAGMLAAIPPLPASDAYVWRLPPWMAPPPVPADNPMSASKVELGRRLFYDIRLSGPGYMACATCHDPRRGFSDGRRVPLGITGQAHHRNAMTLANVGYFRSLTWANPGETRLETQLLRPLFATNPVEMGVTGHEVPVLRHIATNSVYRGFFRRSFPKTDGRIDFANIARAIAAFQRTLVSANSPYDRYRYGSQPDAMSDAAKRGETLFSGRRLNCATCHRPPHFTDAATIDRFHNTGLYNVDGKGGLPPGDRGLADVTGTADDIGKFRTPSLRNVAVSAPYMHDGSLATLNAVIDHYQAGGRAALTGAPSPLRSELIRGFALTKPERADLLAFLHSLTDPTFLKDPRHATPFR